jgi:hypothetical protein
MSATSKVAAPAELVFQPTADKSRFKNLDSKPIQEPEARLWKLSTEAVGPKFTLIESFALLLLLMITLSVIGGCFVELSHLLQSDALRRVTVQAIQPAATGGEGAQITRSFQF